MNDLVSKWSGCAPYFQSVLRMVAGVMFMLSGTMLMFGFPSFAPGMTSAPALMSQMGIGGILLTGGGAVMVLGLFTRPVAFILSGMMAVAYFQFHQPKGMWPALNGGVDAALYCFIWLYISAAGPGPLSIDAMRAKK